MSQVVLGGSNEWREIGASPHGKLNRAGRDVTRKFQIDDPGDYTAVERFITECFPPFSAPGRYPGVFNLRVDDVDIQPMGAIAKTNEGTPKKTMGFPSYAAWEATVKYSPLPYQGKQDGQPDNPKPLLDNLERNWGIGADAMTLPGSRLFFQGDAKPVGDESIAAVLRIDTISHMFTKHHMRPINIPWDAIRECNNRVNASTFSISNDLFPGVDAQTLLFRGVQITNRAASNGEIENVVAFTFMERTAVYDGIRVTWNHLYDATTTTFRRIFRDSAHTKPLYETVANSKIEEMFGGPGA